jgi:hypothetical protein
LEAFAKQLQVKGLNNNKKPAPRAAAHRLDFADPGEEKRERKKKKKNSNLHVFVFFFL